MKHQFKIYCLTSSIFFMGFTLLGCEQVTDKTEIVNATETTTTIEKTIDEQPSQPQAYQKPGAPISFSSTYDGSSEISYIENFELNIKSASEGELRVVLSPQNIIIDNSELIIIRNVTAGEEISIPVSITPTGGDKQYLNIQTSINTAGKTQSKAFSLAIHTPSANSLLQKSLEKTDTKSPYVIMEAEETIIKE